MAWNIKVQMKLKIDRSDPTVISGFPLVSNSLNTNGAHKREEMWLYISLRRNQPHQPSAVISVGTTGAAHVIKRNWHHTAKSSIICWWHAKPKISLVGPNWALWISNSTPFKVLFNTCQRSAQKTYAVDPCTTNSFSKILHQKGMIHLIWKSVQINWDKKRSASLQGLACPHCSLLDYSLATRRPESGQSSGEQTHGWNRNKCNIMLVVSASRFQNLLYFVHSNTLTGNSYWPF